ncbi:MAG: hypothetical protein ACRBBR_07335 [Cellvibrionaceae bacterium]
MFRILALSVLIIAISGCSSSKSKFVYDDLSIDTGEGVDAATPAPEAKNSFRSSASEGSQSTVTKGSQPATFEQYRQWRKANDPSGQTYAEYKQWEAEYKQWIENQAKAVQP